MGFLANLFGKLKYKTYYDNYGISAKSSPFLKTAWEHDIFRATVDCIATHAAKGQVKHVIVDKDGKISKVIHNSPYASLINLKPNPIMSGFDFKYKMIAQLETKSTAIAYIKWENAKPKMVIPLDYSHFEFKEIVGGGYAVEFTDYEGNENILPLEDCIVLRKFYNSRDAGGDGNAPVYSVLDMSKASDEGFMSALNVSNKIRGVHKQKNAMILGDDVEKGQKAFNERFERAAAQGGVVSIDATEDYVPMNVTPFTANSAQMDQISKRIYTYLRTPEEVVQSRYSEQVGLAWYESKIEPIWEMFFEALTNACFTEKEKGFGNRLMMCGGVLMGTSYQTRVNIISQTKEIGVLTVNEQRELLGYAPVEGGDSRQVSLNFIDSENQSQYQTGKEEEDGQK